MHRRPGTVGEVIAADHGVRIYLESPDPQLAQTALEDKGFAVYAHGDGLAVQSASAQDVGHIGVTSGAGIAHLSTLSRPLEKTYLDLVSTTPEMSQS